MDRRGYNSLKHEEQEQWKSHEKRCHCFPIPKV